METEVEEAEDAEVEAMEAETIVGAAAEEGAARMMGTDAWGLLAAASAACAEEKEAQRVLDLHWAMVE